MTKISDVVVFLNNNETYKGLFTKISDAEFKIENESSTTYFKNNDIKLFFYKPANEDHFHVWVNNHSTHVDAHDSLYNELTEAHERI